MYSVAVPNVLCTRQEIADYGDEDDEIRSADLRLIDKLKPFLNDLLCDRYDLKKLAPEVIDSSDLENWWFKVDRIAQGNFEITELPSYLRDAATKYLKRGDELQFANLKKKE